MASLRTTAAFVSNVTTLSSLKLDGNWPIELKLELHIMNSVVHLTLDSINGK